MKTWIGATTFCIALLLGLMPPPALATPADAMAPVLRLYRDFAWEAVIDTPTAGPGFLAQSDAVWSRYFSPRLVALLRKERDCVAQTRALCRLDFDPIWASQDPGATRLKVQMGETPATVQVSFEHPGSGQRIGLRFLLTRVGGRWRIDEIRYADGRHLGEVLAAPE